MVTKISAKRAKEMMDSGASTYIVDVREPFEYEQAHIINAISLPLSYVRLKAQALLPSKNAQVLVYCLSGARSDRAAQLLQEMGYTHVYNIGGILSWPYETQ